MITHEFENQFQNGMEGFDDNWNLKDLGADSQSGCGHQDSARWTFSWCVGQDRLVHHGLRVIHHNIKYLWKKKLYTNLSSPLKT